MAASFIDIGGFTKQIANGQAETVTGIYAPGHFALRVVPQPCGFYTYVSMRDDAATLFQSAAKYGVIGLLAHNHLAGESFFRLRNNDTVSILFGDGRRSAYRVANTARFRKVDPYSMASDLIDLENGQKRTHIEVFDQFYTGDHHVTLQTCIPRYFNPYYGLMFVTAEPVSANASGEIGPGDYLHCNCE